MPGEQSSTANIYNCVCASKGSKGYIIMMLFDTREPGFGASAGYGTGAIRRIRWGGMRAAPGRSLPREGGGYGRASASLGQVGESARVAWIATQPSRAAAHESWGFPYVVHLL